MKTLFWTSSLLSRLLLFLFVLTSGVSLLPDEAQYYAWSTHLDIGYYSKPPGIAWQIFLGTHLFGDSLLGVRCISILLPIAMALIIANLCPEKKTGYFAATAFILSPLGMSASIFATTDSGMLLWALLGTYFYLRNSPFNYTLLGLCLCFGALWKWTIYALLIPFVIYDICVLKKSPYGILKVICISSLGLIPSFVWNMQHFFVTFRHVESALLHTHATLSHGNPIAFFLAGVALLSPGFFLLALPSLVSKKNIFSIIVWILWGSLILASFFRKIQGNWAVLGQIMLFPLLGYSLATYNKLQKAPFIISIVISLVLQGFFLSAPYIGGQLLVKSPLKQGVGVDEIPALLEKINYSPEKYLFSDRYQTVSQLWFLLKKKMYFLNISHLRQNQFCYWPGMEKECVGRDGYFISIIPCSEKDSIPTRILQFKDRLSPYFSATGVPHSFPLGKKATNYVIIIPVEKYSGKTPHKDLCF
jgi:4-amino-4-deoxy-L-arabinose transferase-like glycosyltransferase